MPYTFDVNAWEGWDQERHAGAPPTPSDAHGVRVHYWNPEDEEDGGMFWAYQLYGSFETWAEWWVYIGALLEQHGKELADDSEPQ